LALAAPMAQAATWDFAADFPGVVYPNTNAQNPNGAWSYGWETWLNPTPQGDFSPFVRFGYNPAYPITPYWDNNNSPDTGSIWKNLWGGTLFGVKLGEVSLNPGPGAVCTVARWTSPLAGMVSISGAFGSGDKNPENYYIYVNNSLVWYRNSSNTEEFSLTQTVSVGDHIDFIVGGNNMFGNTPLAAAIDPAPLPGAVWLLGSGLLGLAGLGRRFKRN